MRKPRVLLIGQWIESIFRGLLFARGRLCPICLGALHSFLRHPLWTRGHIARHQEEATTQDAFGSEASAEPTNATARTRAVGPVAARPRSSCGSPAARRSTRSAARSASSPASSPSDGALAGMQVGLQSREPDYCDSFIRDLSHVFHDEPRTLGIESIPSFVRHLEGNGCVERFIRA